MDLGAQAGSNPQPLAASGRLGTGAPFLDSERVAVASVDEDSAERYAVIRAYLRLPCPCHGSTKSCSGWRTVSTGQGAARTTFSATLPSSSWAIRPRPWVPITIRSISFSFA